MCCSCLRDDLSNRLKGGVRGGVGWGGVVGGVETLLLFCSCFVVVSKVLTALLVIVDVL